MAAFYFLVIIAYFSTIIIITKASVHCSLSPILKIE